ncbi:MAG: GNAT family N-acetyltransferase [Methanofollis sp.]|uniref:GNAT family N-acetyltransferase n=1 Tax=Methanofollis sp. TaxID=2052835 RepID=UPI00260A688B|nr:GNAT family N-acetyltransferase [Methanofollis sp.]MDD4254331.1 GNAT family N-acetyltransferase [Methanofollis sp.]
MDSRLSVRQMERKDVDFAITLARDEGWNPGLHDADAFYAQDPEGFFIAEADGDPVACSSMVRYGDRFAFFGLLIVRPDVRGRGYGLAVTRAALAHAGDRTIGGDGVLAMQQKYHDRLGFDVIYRNIRYRGTGGGTMPAGLVPASAVPFADLVAYDAGIFSAARPKFLAPWLLQEGATALALSGRDGIAGYGVVRPCFEGYKIGPLFADTPAAAEALLDGLLASVPDAPVFFDVPEPNPAAVSLARARGMVQVFETARIYRGAPPDVPLDRVYGVTTFELG